MPANASIIMSKDDLGNLVDYYSEVDAFAFDVETIGDQRADALQAPVVWLSLATDGRCDTIPMGHPNGNFLSERPKPNKKGEERMLRGVDYADLNPKYDFLVEMERFYDPVPDQLERGFVFGQLSPLFESDALKIGHNIKFDLHAVSKYYGDQPPTGPYYDTMIAAWVLDASLGRTKGKLLNLKDTARRELKEVVEKGIGENIALWGFDEVAKYSLIDADVTWRLWQALEKKFATRPKMRWVRDLEMEVMHAILEMESNGVLIDEDRLREIGKDLLRDMDLIQAQMYLMAGRKFNIRSNRDKQEILYSSKKDGGLGLRPMKLTETGAKKSESALTIYDYSTDQESLAVHEGNEFVDALHLYSGKAKLHGTYVLPYIGDVETKVERKLRKGRIYAQFVQHGAESGRMSSRNPNLQNVPARSDDGKKLREVFIADPGHLLISADYSQIEPRIIASLSGDKTMIATYRDGGDVYQAVADRMNVTRDAGKKLVLSISYGIGAPKISRDIGCSIREARDLMDFFAARFTAIPRHKNVVISRARKDKFSETMFGRRRPFPEIMSSDDMKRSYAERSAYNFVIQGSAADIMKIALANLYAALPQEAQLLMTIHDEVVVQAPADMVEEISAIIQLEMEAARPPSLVVPLVADVGHGLTWKDAKA